MKTHSILMAAAGATASDTLYVEDVFSTYLYTGNGSTQTINNGIDLAGKGGLVWSKYRVAGPSSYWDNHWLIDTNRGGNNYLHSNLTSGQNGAGSLGSMISFGSSGYTLPSGNLNYAGSNLVSWTFRKAPKFFDVVTYTGNGGTEQQIPHALGSAPGMIIVKRTDNTGNWYVCTPGIVDWNNSYLVLNSTAAKVSSVDIWQATSGRSSTTFGVYNAATVNASGATYVAYLFANNAGGFGTTGTDSVISSGSFTTDASGNATVNLGWEPQWVTIKSTTGVQDWLTIDQMRGWTASTGIFDSWLRLNAANTDATTVDWGEPTSTGFNSRNLQTSATYFYIAIRRPHKPPTSGTSVFRPATSSTYEENNTTGFPVDMQILAQQSGAVRNCVTVDRLRGVYTSPTGGNTVSLPILSTALTDAEVNASGSLNWDNTGFKTPAYFGSSPQVFWSFRRAPGFFDVVCYTSSGTSPQTISHSLGVAPQLIIAKQRNNSSLNWFGANSVVSGRSNLSLNSSKAFVTFSSYDATATTFNTRSLFDVDAGITGEGTGNGASIVAYLFATCPGVSKVGSYTGNGSNQTINCGFTTGARFVLIKRTDSTGDWYVWDSARGIVSANDPHLSLNTAAAEVTTDDSVDPDNSGFIVNQVAATNINVSSATYIYLAIA